VGKHAINLFGRLSVLDADGAEVQISGKKPQALLAFLALNPGQPQSRERLAGLLWGDRFDDQARQSLRQCVSKLRKSLGDGSGEILLIEGDQISLNMADVVVDAVIFESLSKSDTSDAMTAAIDLFNAPLLSGFYIKQAEFDDWLEHEREHHSELAFNIFERLAQQQSTDGKFENAILTARRALAIDPLSEKVHRTLMQFYADSGQRSAALKQYQICSDLLERELDAEPDAATQKLHKELLSSQSGEAEAPKESVVPGKKTSGDKPTIAVLPFDDMSAAKDQEYFANGMTEDIITALTKYRWLSIIARNSSFSYKGKSLDLRQVGVELGANYIVEGSVRRADNRIRITAQLIDAETGNHIWANKYDRSIEDIFAVQDEITETLAATIEPELALAEAQRVATKSTDNLAAWDCYHIGLFHAYNFSNAENLEAQKYFRKAIEIDPNFGAAYARLSYTMILSAVYYEAEPTEELLDEALSLAKRAAEIDNQDAGAHFAVGRAHLARGEYDVSVDELKTAIDLNPSMAMAHCGLGDSLAYAGQLEESIACFDDAIRLSPHDPYRWAFLMYGSLAYLFLKQHDKAIEWARQAIRLPNSHYRSNAVLISALGHTGQTEKAQEALSELLKRQPDYSCKVARNSLFYVKDAGQVDHYVEGLRLAGLPE